jgi:hypothetical protein
MVAARAASVADNTHNIAARHNADSAAHFPCLAIVTFIDFPTFVKTQIDPISPTLCNLGNHRDRDKFKSSIEPRNKRLVARLPWNLRLLAATVASDD